MKQCTGSNATFFKSFIPWLKRTKQQDSLLLLLEKEKILL